MSRIKLLIVGVFVLAGSFAATVRLAAQPEPYRPIATDSPYELILPPGTYQHLLIAFEGGANSRTLKASLKAPSGELTVLIPAGETLVIPLSAGGNPWTISQQVTLKLTHPSGNVHATATTQAGPVRLEPPKK